MYSWIASWFNEDNEKNISTEQALYAQNNEVQSKREEWTWVEVLEDETDKGLIFIQSDESIMNNAMAGPVVKPKRKRRIPRSDVAGTKVFKRSLYTDLPLIRKKYRSMRRVNSRMLDIKAQTLCKRQRTTSELLSATFPTEEFPMLQKRIEFDVIHLLENRSFVKSLLEVAFKHELHIKYGLQQWLEKLLQKDRARRAKNAVDQLANEWKKSAQFCIEWKKEAPRARKETTGADLRIIEERYKIPIWLRRIDIIDQFEHVPDWLKKINVSFFKQPQDVELKYYVENITDVQEWMRKMDVRSLVTEQSEIDPQMLYYVENITDVPEWMRKMDVRSLVTEQSEIDPQMLYSVENITDVPEWMRRMGVCSEPRELRDRTTALQKLPLWMRNIDLIDDWQFEHVSVPSWMASINLSDDESNIPAEEIELRPFYGMRGSKSWNLSSNYNFPSSWITPRRTWPRQIASETLLHNAQSICSSMINIAVVLATATCKATGEKSSELLQQVSQVRPRLSPASQKRKCLKSTREGEKRKVTVQTTAKKNKKWLKKVNAVSKLQGKLKKHTGRNFSGSKCVRAC